MHKETYISLIFILTLFLSCSEALDSGSLHFEKKLVLNCLFNPDENWQLQISSNSNILDTNDTLVYLDDAHIVLSDAQGNSPGAFISKGNGIYVIPDRYPESGKQYIIEVSHPDFQTVKADSEVPASFLVDELKMEQQSENDQVYSNLSFLYDATGLGPSFLIIENHLSRLYLNSESDTIWVREYDLLRHVGGLIYSDDFIPNNPVRSLLCFREVKIYTTLVFSSLNGFRKEDEDFLVKGEAKIIFTRASEEYYRYIKSIEIYRENMNNYISSIVPPVEIFSNVDGGLGIFAGSHQVGVEYSF